MGLFDIFKSKKKVEENSIAASVKEVSLKKAKRGSDSLSVLLEELPATYGLNEDALVEIKDTRVVERIGSLTPAASNVGYSIKNTVKDLSSKDETLYRVILKKGGTLVDSKGTPGAKRAMTMAKNGIQENAELIPLNQKINKSLSLASTGAAVMSLASMVVGQYYMHQVDTQLNAISASISKVTDFLDVQYKSQVASLIESVYSISKFQISSIENEELRGRELNNLQMLRTKCQELLNQAETTLETLISKNCTIYEEYERAVREIGKWSQYQTILVKILYQIDTLDFTLHLGIKSKEQCFSTFALHSDKSETTRTYLIDWHNKQCEALKINLEECRRKHTGILALLEKPISWINDDWNYQAVGRQMVSMIKGQTAEIPKISYEDENLFEDDVQIIAKNGKYYYLAASNTNK